MATLTTQTYRDMSLEEFTELAYQEGWSDGLPVLPPTEKRVGAILAHLQRDPRQVVGVVPPGDGVATIEQIAINCAMAGCKPEYAPIVIAAVQAMLADEFQLGKVQTSTRIFIVAQGTIEGVASRLRADFYHGHGLDAMSDTVDIQADLVAYRDVFDG